jgi:hypothetical protein
MSSQAFRVRILEILFWHVWRVVQETSASEAGDRVRHLPDCCQQRRQPRGLLLSFFKSVCKSFLSYSLFCIHSECHKTQWNWDSKDVLIACHLPATPPHVLHYYANIYEYIPCAVKRLHLYISCVAIFLAKIIRCRILWIFFLSVACLMTNPHPLAERVHHRTRYCAFSLNLRYPFVSLRSSSSCLHILSRLLLTSILPSLFISTACCRKQFG